MTDVRIAQARDAEYVAAVLAGGFHDDPVLSWTFSGQRRREKLVTYFLFLVREAFLPLGATYLTDGAVACWTPPNPPPWPEERSTRFEALLRERCPPDDLRRLEALDTALQVDHPAGPHWYLSLIAAEPRVQGRGLGTALLSHTLRERVDRDRLPAYLDATQPRNVRLYERQGFRAARVIEISDGPAFTRMWREAAT